ncbi:serine hydrolase domain-containing protein [Actinoallomurus sp. CA-150999]|uniref:serine hydrolase domain-containing protein n=1 Tax=Actinoallomurus sp. CA-150999 TaxID=3239887 RepID=UPI003D91CD54
MRRHLIITGAMLTLTTALGPTASAGTLPPLDPAVLQKAISGLPSATVTGALVRVSGPAGRWSGTSGTGDVATGAPVPANGTFRIGSTSKIFTASVVLQLVAEHRIDLDENVQHYLPDLLPASYPAITVRQVLNHTSGLPGTSIDSGDARWFVEHRLDSWTPQELVANAVTHPLEFAPGTRQQYNGTNYFVAGLLIERVTGRTYAEEVRRRIIEPLRLHDTYVLDRHDPRLPGPHSHGYVAVTDAGVTTLHDVSEQSPYPWAEGGIISSAGDLTRLIRALFRGRVVPRTELQAMFTVPDVAYVGRDNCNIGPNAGRACFSVGLTRTVFPNGVTVWGKTGARPGYTGGLFATRDLRRVLVYSLNATGNKDGSESPYLVKIAAAVFAPGLGNP